MALNKKDLVFFILYIVLAKQLYLWALNKGLGVRFNNHNPGKCRVVPGITCGSEKISVSIEGLAFITNGQKSLTNCNHTYLKGNIYLFDFNQPGKNVKLLKIRGAPSEDFLKTFEPSGMDIFEKQNYQKIKLFVINHAHKNDSVEIFEFYHSQPNELYYVQTIRNKNFVCLNDITIINEDEFYVTNSLQYCHSSMNFLKTLELVIGFDTANILYYKEGYTAVAAYGSFFNGIVQSPDNQYVYCVSSSSSTVNIYNRTVGGAIKLIRQVKVGYTPDNIHVDQESGDLYVGLIKEAFGMLQFASNSTTHTSAAAVKLSIAPNKDPRLIKVSEILHEDGKDFVSVVSSAAYFKGMYLFGTAFDGLAYCAGKTK